MMFLNLDDVSAPMKRVYLLSERLRADPEYMASAQAMTLNSDKPLLGLKGTHGLFGSSQWWISIEQHRIPLLFVSGIILRAYAAGMGDGADEINCIDLLLDDGSERSEGVYANSKADIALFQVGCRVEMVFALDEMKKQTAPDGTINRSKTALEVAVSLVPIPRHA
jgi:hypothetical protein